MTIRTNTTPATKSRAGAARRDVGAELFCGIRKTSTRRPPFESQPRTAGLELLRHHSKESAPSWKSNEPVAARQTENVSPPLDLPIQAIDQRRGQRVHRAAGPGMDLGDALPRRADATPGSDQPGNRRHRTYLCWGRLHGLLRSPFGDGPASAH